MRVAFVVTRFGKEVNGGAERHCRQFVERLSHCWEIDVLTTCALDYSGWKDHYSAGICLDSGYRVHRFSVDYARPSLTFASFYNALINLHLLESKNLDIRLDSAEHIEALHRHPDPDVRQHRIFTSEYGLGAGLLERMEQEWMRLQGPVSGSLIRHLRAHQHQYDAVFFFSYNYASTYYGITQVPDKSILIPTAHKEACLAFNLFKPMFRQVAYYLFNSEPEKNLLEGVCPEIREKPGQVCGAGIEAVDPPEDADIIIDSFGLVKGQYVIYVGRLDESKGLRFLFDNFMSYKQQHQGPLKLILAGRRYMELPDHPDILFPGFVSERVKLALLSGAALFVMPSAFESLSLSLLEAWSLGVPALVNGNCEVLKFHCLGSSGGLYYEDEGSFQEHLRNLLTRQELNRGLGMRGQGYVRKNYIWEEVTAKVAEAAGYVMSHKAGAPS